MNTTPQTIYSPSTFTKAAALRHLADWIDEQEVPDSEIKFGGLDISHSLPTLTLRGSDRVCSLYAGSGIVAKEYPIENGTCLELSADGIDFFCWTDSDRPPTKVKKVDVTL